MKKFVKLGLLTAVVAAAFTASASAATVVNGNFDTGNTAGWTVFTFPGSAGNWQNYSGTTPPVSASEHPAVPAAIGSSSAIADQTGEMASVLYQDITLEPGMTHKLDFSYWYINESPFTSTVNTGFGFPGGPDVQQIFIDVIKPSAAPLTALPSDTLASFFKSNLGDPDTLGWTNGTLDLTSLAGQTVRVRFLVVNQNSYLLAGFDNVSLTSKDVTAPLITNLKLSKSRFRTTGKRGGSKLSLTLDEAASLKLTVEKRSKGKRSGSKCVKPTAKNRTKKNCTRWTPVRGSIKATGVAGSNSIKFNGKLNRKALASGKYRFKVLATDPSGNTTTALKSFTVLP